jgi:hypothetical protein
MRVLAMAVGWWLSAGAAKAPALPRQVSDFYALLAQGGAVDAVAERRGGRWAYVTTPDGKGGKGDLVVDDKSGYMRLEYGGDGIEVMEVALLATQGDAPRLVLVAISGYSGTGEVVGMHAYAFTGATYHEVTSRLGALAEVGPTDFLDEAYLKSPPARADKPAEKMALTRLTFELPRHGTTVVAHMETLDAPPSGDDGAARLEATQAFVASHQRYSWVNLTWNKVTGTFAVGKKGP